MSGHDDDGFERLLRGDTPGTPAERELGAFVEDLREAFPAEPLLARDVHLARITEAARLLAEKGDPVARPVSNAAVREGHASGLPKRRGTIMRVPVWKSLAARVVAGLVVLMSMFGGMAFAGALPGGIQDKVANAVAAVVDLQSANDDVTTEESETEEPVETESPDPDETEDPVETEDQDAADSESDDQGEDADDQGEDESATESDDQGEDADDQGEDADDQGEDESESTETESETESDDQDDDTQDTTETEDQDQDENE